MIFAKLSDLFCAAAVRFDGIGYTEFTSAVVRKGSTSIPLSFSGRLDSVVASRPEKGTISILIFGLMFRGFVARRNFN